MSRLEIMNDAVAGRIIEDMSIVLDDEKALRDYLLRHCSPGRSDGVILSIPDISDTLLGY